MAIEEGRSHEAVSNKGCVFRLIRLLVPAVLVVAGVGWLSFWTLARALQDHMTKSAVVESLHLGGPVHRLDALFRGRQAGGAVVASLGPDGVFLVDGFASEELARKALVQLEQLAGDLPIRFLVTTHPHPDHIGGNAFFAQRGATIIGHSSTAAWMARSLRPAGFLPPTPPYPTEARPSLEVADEYEIAFNDETIRVLALGPAHTESDVAVWFVGSKVAHVGDLFHGHGSHSSASWINGGDAAGLLRAVDQLLDLLPDDVRIVGGHSPPGSWSTVAELAQYRRILAHVLSALGDRPPANLAVEVEREFSSWFSHSDEGIMHGPATGWVENLGKN
ncbi:MAG: MBL fold metallo-hydrolase [Thermoanaerobaculia bacterium]|nr:MBL fold metallo-hydrolase [Thermoanaerobaculia bacterium]